MQLQVQIIVTAELGRRADFSGGRPSLTDLRDTDVLAQAADRTILLHRPDLNDSRHPRARQADLIVAKNRHGRRGTATVLHQLSLARIYSVAPPLSPAAPLRPAASPPPTASTPASRRYRAKAGTGPGTEEQLVFDDDVEVLLRRVGVGDPPVICLGRHNGSLSAHVANDLLDATRSTGSEI